MPLSSSVGLNDLFTPKEIAEHVQRVRTIALGLVRRLPPRAAVAVEELESAGMVGLVIAAKKFDKSRGSSFWTFAYARVLGAMMDELRTLDPLTRHERGQVNNGEEIAALQRVIVEFVDSTPANDNGVIAVDGLNLYLICAKRQVAEYIPLEGALDQKRVVEIIREEIEQLPKRQSEAILGYFWHRMRLKDIGAMQGGLSESRICQVMTLALGQLRHRLIVRLGQERFEELAA